MSLQRRLLLSLGGSFLLLWLAVAGLLYVHLDRQISQTLDQRLAASATMVAGLVSRHPEILQSSVGATQLVNPATEGVACQIRSATGQVLLRTDGAGAVLHGEASPGYALRTVNGEDWRLYTVRFRDTLITTADRMIERTALRNAIIVVMVAPFALALAGSLIMLWWGTRQGLRPLHRLFRELQRRRPDNLEPVNIGPAPTELVPVVATLNDLFGRVERAVHREQRFASNAAHEFRTPLTAIKTHLQVAQQVDGSRQAQALSQAEAGVGRLQRVTEQLLMLARLEQQTPWPVPDECRMDDVVTDALGEMPDLHRLVIEPAAETAILAVPRALAATALRNLMENALRYSERTEPVTVTRVVVEGWGWFIVRDHGSGGASCPSDHASGHGLGLTIVQAIVTRFDGVLRRENNDYGGQDWMVAFRLV